MAINTQKVVMGGIGAGVVLTALDFVVNGLLLAEQNAAAMEALNPALADNMAGVGMIVTVVAIDFLLAFVLVWTYAAIRPRFGPGPKTAVIAAVQPWLVAAAIYTFMTVAGMYTWGYLAIGAVSMLVLFVVTSLVGAKIYSEE